MLQPEATSTDPITQPLDEEDDEYEAISNDASSDESNILILHINQ